MSAEDEDMSNALMNDMADALRSAGLGSMVADEEAVQVDETVEDSGEESIDSVVVDEQTNEELSDEDQVRMLIEEGEFKSRSNSPQEALAAFNKAIALDPSSDMAWFNRGVLLEAQQDARGARQAFQICLDLNPIMLLQQQTLQFYWTELAMRQVQRQWLDEGWNFPLAIQALPMFSTGPKCTS